MGSNKRGPQDAFSAANSDLKRSKMTPVAKEEVIVILDDCELEEEGGEVKEEAGVEDGGLVEPTIADHPVILLLHICFLCHMELDYAPGDLTMKTHYISHYSPGSLLETIGHDVGEKLRRPYAECNNIGKEMILQQLNIHLELAHNKLRMLMERDTSPGMAEVLSIMYDFDNHKAKKHKKSFGENEFAKEEINSFSALLGFPPMKVETEEIEVLEEDGGHDEVKEEPSWTQPLFVDDESDEERTDPTWTPRDDDFNDEEKYDPGDCDEEGEQNDPHPSQNPNLYGFGGERENETVYILVAPQGPGNPTLTEEYNCLLCKAKEGKRLNLIELPFHYALCLYERGQFASLVDPGEENRDFEGKAIDEYGRKYRYKCQVPNCSSTLASSLPRNKSVGFKEWAVHAGAAHYLVERAMEREVEKIPAMKEVLAKVRQVRKSGKGVLLDNMPGPSREEIHNCLLCSGKDGKNLSLDPSKLCYVRYHYAVHFFDTGALLTLGGSYLPGSHNSNKDGSARDVLGRDVKYRLTCSCTMKRQVGYKVLCMHMATKHGGLEEVMLMDKREEIRSLVEIFTQNS